MTIHQKSIRIGFKSRVWTWVFRRLLKPMLRRMIRGSYENIARQQLMCASRECNDTAGLPQGYRIVNRVPGLTVGEFEDRSKPVILWLHGGAFILPAVPAVHLRLLALLCRELDAVGFLPDYRLAPFNRFPAALDDCERAYSGLLELGFDASRIAIAGDSAGGNLTLGVLQRARRKSLAMPACVLLVSPATELGRMHGPPSRYRMRRRDAVLPIASLQRVDDLYAGDWDASDPELSPLYADYRGFPPMFFITGADEVLCDDSILAAQQAEAAGVDVRCDVWPVLPHAFPLFEALFPETAVVRGDMVDFLRKHLSGMRTPVTLSEAKDLASTSSADWAEDPSLRSG